MSEAVTKSLIGANQPAIFTVNNSSIASMLPMLAGAINYVRGALAPAYVVFSPEVAEGRIVEACALAQTIGQLTAAQEGDRSSAEAVKVTTHIVSPAIKDKKPISMLKFERGRADAASQAE